jgi:hypothetical protein
MSLLLWAFETLSDPTEADSNPTDGFHTCPKIPMLFNIFARTKGLSTKYAVAGKKVNLRTDVEQAEDDQQEEA